MARREIRIAGECWMVYPSGRVTRFDRDEMGLLFEKGTGRHRIRRATRVRPLGTARRDVALAEFSDEQLRELFHHSQPAWTSPEVRAAPDR
ncbi:MAG: hypothetical protein ACE5FJ_11045 [Gemmatimonadales bacterium]